MGLESQAAWIGHVKEQAREVYDMINDIEVGIMEGVITDLSGAMADVHLVSTSLVIMKSRMERVTDKALREPLEAL